MRPANDSAHHFPNPLASHTPAPANMESAAPAPAPASSAPPDRRPSQDAGPSRPSSSSAAARHDLQSPAPSARPSVSAGGSHRPSLARARSDFGPRPHSQPQEPADDSSVDGPFKIRHGWDDQLNSEEYSNMLTSVRCVDRATVSGAD